MASPTLSETLSLTDERINEKITQKSAGVYALDATRAGGFTYSYVGRSDKDVNDRLHDWVSTYKFFKYAYCSSAKAAFEAECELYHDHRPPDNTNHPQRPDGSGWKCPRCPVFR
jgi:hypothetical protein